MEIKNFKHFQEQNLPQPAKDLFMQYFNTLTQDILENKEEYEEDLEIKLTKKSIKELDFSKIALTVHVFNSNDEGEEMFLKLRNPEDSLENDEWVLLQYVCETLLYPKS